MAFKRKDDKLAVPMQEGWMNAGKIGALRSPDSPFVDGYDLFGEEKILKGAGLLDTDEEVNPLHPLWARLCEYEMRQPAMEGVVALHKRRQGADPLVDDERAARIARIGRLATAPGDLDSLRVHTRDAYRLFMGRARAPDGAQLPKWDKSGQIVGGKKCAAALLALFNLSGRDNPYADWALVQFIERVGALRKKLDAGTLAVKKLMDKQAERGILLHVMASEQPQAVELGFRSPYGYEVSFMIGDFDYAVRHLRTVGMKGLMSTDQQNEAIRGLAREARAIFVQVVRLQNLLLDERMVALSRADWLPEADEAARRRVLAARELIGEVPQDVLTLARKPKHHKALRRLSGEEREQLHKVDLAQLAQVPEGEAANAEQEQVEEKLL